MNVMQDAVDSVKTKRVLFVQPFTTINKVWIPVLIYWYIE